MSTPFPGAQTPAVVQSTGFFTTQWILWLQQFAQQPGPIAAVALGASPASFTASSAGTLTLSGGAVSDLMLTRSGVTADLGAQRSVLMANNDVARVTYTGSVTASFIPS